MAVRTQTCTKEYLTSIPLPNHADSYTVISHEFIINHTMEQLALHGFQVEKEALSIELNNVKGDLNMVSNTGNIVAEKIELVSEANFDTEYGSVEIDFVNDVSIMSFDLKTTYGNIHLQDGAIMRKTQGNLLIERGGIKVNATTDSGNIKIK